MGGVCYKHVNHDPLHPSQSWSKEYQRAMNPSSKAMPHPPKGNVKLTEEYKLSLAKKEGEYESTSEVDSVPGF